MATNRETSDGLTTCGCGSAWWELRRTPSSGDKAAVAVDENGAVIAYAGDLVCIECGAMIDLHHERVELRLVE